MTGWTEENFLDAISLEGQQALTSRLCKDSQTFLATRRIGGSRFSEYDIATHLVQCKACRELTRRVVSFDDGVVADHPPDWEQIEKRLDCWLAGFLAANPPAQQGKFATFYSGCARQLRSFRPRLVFASVAVCFLVATAFLLGHFSMRPPLNQPAVNVARRTPPAKEDQKASGAQGSPQPAALPVGTPANVTSKRLPNPERQHTRSTIQPEQLPQLEAAKRPPLSFEVPSAAPEISAPSADDQTKAVARTEPAAGPQSPTSMLASPRVAGLDTASPSLLPLAKSPALPKPPPQEIQLKPGVRIWIYLKSPPAYSTIASAFDGSLLLPVSQDGGILIERGVGVSGTVRMNGTKLNIRVLELRIHGLDYRLQSSGEGGADEALQYNHGTVLESWMHSLSSYVVNISPVQK